MKRMNQCLGGALLAAAACTVSFGAQADGNPVRDPINGADWWQWALSLPAAGNPVLDATGTSCMYGQRGSVWFLAGSFGATASRTCSVPEGVQLFFPIVNSVNIDSPGVCGQVGHLSVAQLRAFSAAFVDSIKSVSATIDSRPVRPVRRMRSEVFPVAMAAEGLFNGPGCLVPAAVYPRSVDDGYYAEVDDLSVGEHVLQITASDGGNFNLNVTYRLIVVPRDRR